MKLFHKFLTLCALACTIHFIIRVSKIGESSMHLFEGKVRRVGFPEYHSNVFHCDFASLEYPIRIINHNESLAGVKTSFKLFIHPPGQDSIISESYFSGNGFELGMHNEYLTAVRALADPRHPDPVIVVDVGANIGVHSLFFSSLHPIVPIKVYAFEPFAPNVNLLRCSALLNDFQDVLTIENLAVGTTNGTVCMDAPENDNKGHVVVQFSRSECNDAVSMVTLDSYWKNVIQQRVDILKIDCEGMEPLILGGAKSMFRDRPVPHIFLEFVPIWIASGVYENNAKAFLKGLLAHGYKIEVLKHNLSLARGSTKFDEFYDKLEVILNETGHIVDLHLSRF
jgi:FkbM family methyltransferase